MTRLDLIAGLLLEALDQPEEPKTVHQPPPLAPAPTPTPKKPPKAKR